MNLLVSASYRLARRPWRERRALMRRSGGSYHDQYIIKSDTFSDALEHQAVTVAPSLARLEGERAIFADDCMGVDAAIRDVVVL